VARHTRLAVRSKAGIEELVRIIEWGVDGDNAAGAGRNHQIGWGALHLPGIVRERAEDWKIDSPWLTATPVMTSIALSSTGDAFWTHPSRAPSR
jgi:hypothetical protein